MKKYQKIGLYDKVMKGLKENTIDIYELAGVEPNPRHTTVNKGAKLCKDPPNQNCFSD